MEARTKRLLAASWMFLVSAAAMTTVTYAWFQISRTPYVKDLGLTVMVSTALEMAPDEGGVPGEWSEKLDLTDALADVVPLKPVTYIESRDAFLAPGYHQDGRPSYQDGRELSDAENGSVRDSEELGYYIAYDFWMRTTGADATVALAKGLINENGQEGLGTFLIGSAADGAQTAAEAAIRLGFRIRDVDENGRVTGEEDFFIYEPNADIHLDGGSGYLETANVDGRTYYPAEKYFVQEASVFYGAADASARVTPGEFLTEQTDMFHIYDGKMKKLTLYIWLEGQDADCDNSSMDVNIYGNIQFDAKKLTGDGKRRIESR